MNKKTLEQYRSLQREIPKLHKKLEKLYERKENLQEVAGKVKASAKEFPYIESHVSVQMYEPKEADRVNEQIRIIEDRLENSEEDLLKIETFIAGIKNSTDRQIFEMVYLEGMKLEKVGKELGYTKGRISQKISNILKD